MLAAVAHTFTGSGEYRGAVHLGEKVESVFYIKADKNSPVAQVNVDLAVLTAVAAQGGSCCCPESKEVPNKFVVNPKGYAVFHVSSGSGGYYVHLRKADEDPKQKVFDTRKLEEGDIYSAVVLRPGRYSVTNTLSKAGAELTVHYLSVSKTAYRPPAPVRVDVGDKGFEPRKIEVHPGQGILFHFSQPSRIKIDLVKADDGPRRSQEPLRAGWRKLSVAQKTPTKPKSQKQPRLPR